MARKKRVVFLALALVPFLLLCKERESAATSVKFRPPEIEVVVGETVDVSVIVEVSAICLDCFPTALFCPCYLTLSFGFQPVASADPSSFLLTEPVQVFHTLVTGGRVGTGVLTATILGGDVVLGEAPVTVIEGPLVASASASPTSGEAPLEVSFTGSVTGGLRPYSFLWDFGDGTISMEQNPTHTYTSQGSYRAVLTVTDSTGNDDSDSVTIRVSTVPMEATATADPTSGEAPLTVSFTGSVTGGAPPYSFLWDFGDGTTSTAQNPTYTYTVGGRFRAILTVTDSSGKDDSDSVTINVSTFPLRATAIADPTSGEAPLTVSFTGSASGGAPPYSFLWDFGDGTTSTEQNPTHTYTVGGRFRAILAVTDSSGKDDSDSVTICQCSRHRERSMFKTS